jgi:hypothetical protein
MPPLIPDITWNMSFMTHELFQEYLNVLALPPITDVRGKL